MKSDKKVEKDPIKDKYNVKIGFFKKIQIKSINFWRYIKSNKDIKEDFSDSIDIFVYVFISGILGSLFMSLPLFGLEISIMNIFGIGAGIWLIENKFTEIVTRILGSIKIVQINN
jgi:hypothetical protein